MTATYDCIATTTLTTTTTNITFSSIPATFTDLVLVFNGFNTGTLDGITLRCNGDTGSNYSVTALDGNGTTASSERFANTTNAYLGNINATMNTILININNYSNTTTNKTILNRMSTTGGSYVRASVHLWRNTAAINSLTLGSVNLASGTMATLYGIKAE